MKSVGKSYYFYDKQRPAFWFLLFAEMRCVISQSVISYEYYVLQNLTPLLVSLFSVQAEFCCGSL